MQVLHLLINKVDKILLAAIASIGVLIFIQLPQFTAQYLQRLGGHINEAYQASIIYNLPELAERANKLEENFKIIKNSDNLNLILNLLKYSDKRIISETWKNYTPGFTFNQNCLFYAIFGFFIAICCYGLLKIIIKIIFFLLKKIFIHSPKN